MISDDIGKYWILLDDIEYIILDDIG